MSIAKETNLAQARAFLAERFAVDPTTVDLVGEGAWSRCFGFQRNGQAQVIRFGSYLDDFENDRRAAAYSTPDLPVPRVFEIGEALGGYYAISTRAFGIPLEEVKAAQWRALVPAVAAALEAMRAADISSTTGFGGWGADGNAPSARWSDHLLAVNVDAPEQRTHGWRKQLATHSLGEETFVWGYDLLQRVVDNDAPRSLLHCDLINRNVLATEDKLSGVFDWGCSRYGDHLYELAWFEFWGSWYPEMDMQLLRTKLDARWRSVGYTPTNLEARLTACYLHIGLDHLAYNAYCEDWTSLTDVVERMRTLIPDRGI